VPFLLIQNAKENELARSIGTPKFNSVNKTHKIDYLECCCLEDGAFVPLVVSIKGKE
jgi:hypothetical protein